ncbi:phosphatase PAP2 family protein [Nocardia terpenica]|nr:phosphatase PAP2 family protein [Nocardia terpenica]
MVLLILALLTAVVTAVLVRRGILRWAKACALTAVAALTGGIVELTGDVVDDDGVTRIDPATMNWVIPHRTGWLTPIAKAVSDLGAISTMGVVALAACAWFAWRRRWPQLVLIAAAAGGAGAIGAFLKVVVGRQRPPVADHLVVETSQSFPSGHTLGSTAIVGALTALVVLSLHRRAPKIAAALGAATFVLAVGASRLYLGVHWPTDVLAGMAIGTLWLTLCVSAYTLYLRLREPSPTTHTPIIHTSAQPPVIPE